MTVETESPPVSPADIAAAHMRIGGHVRRTPILEAASPIAGAPPVSLKLEFLQHAGSFKSRGAFNNLLSRPAPAVGCAAASGGNHGAAVAYAARALGLAARIFVPEISSPAKVAKIRAYGAQVQVQGRDYFEALALCDAHVAASGALPVHAYDTRETIAGQGTLAREWEVDLARLGHAPLDTVLVAVGGGGLIAGVAAWWSERVKVVSVEPEGAYSLRAAFEAGAPVETPVDSIAADSLGARSVGKLVFEIARRRVAQTVLVEDAAIQAARRALWREFNVVSEPGGATAYAALLSGAYRAAPGERIGVLLCGANADLAAFAPEA